MKRVKQKLMLLLFVFVSAAVFGDTISGDLSFDMSKIEYGVKDNYDTVTYKGDNPGFSGNPGEPDLPYAAFQAFIPEGAEVISITVTSQIKHTIRKGFNAYPKQEDFIVSGTPVFTGPNSTIYGTNKEYPYDAPIVYKGTSELRGYRLANFLVNPFSYNPVTKELSFTEYMEFDILYALPSLPPGGSTGGYQFSSDLFQNIVESAVINPEEVTPTLDTESASRSTFEAVDFLIITSNALKPAFEAYAQQRGEERNLKTEVVTVESIYTSYGGATNQIKIKNCIKNYVRSRNTIYVLLGGDVSVVPDQDVYASSGWITDNSIPGDIFYSCLDGDVSWNSNGNDKVGEQDLDEVVGDSVDIVPDVMIGRLPFTTAAEVNRYADVLSSHIRYRQNSTSFTKKILLSGSRISSPGDAERESWKIYEEYIDPYWQGEEVSTLFDSELTEDMTATHFADKFNEGFNLLYTENHGGPDVWGFDHENTLQAFWTSDMDKLDAVSTLSVTLACQTAWFDDESKKSLGESFVEVNGGGSLVYIGASRTNYDGVGRDYNRRFFKYLTDTHYTQDANSIGLAFTQMKIYMGCSDRFRWLQYIFNYLGDPTIVFREKPSAPDHEEMPFYAEDLGMNEKGDLFLAGHPGEGPHPGYGVYKWDGSYWDKYTWNAADGDVVGIDVDPDGIPWAVGETGVIKKWNPSTQTWTTIYGLARDIGIGADGTVCMVNKVNNKVYAWDGSSWIPRGGNGKRVSVDAEGNPWIVDDNRNIFKFNGISWEKLPGQAYDIGVNANNNVVISVPRGNDTPYIYKWSGQDWIKLDAQGLRVEVTALGEPVVSDIHDWHVVKTYTTENMIKNGNFDQGLYRWYGYENNTGKVNLSSETGGYLLGSYTAKVDVTNGGTYLWDALFATTNIPIEQGTTYRLSFWARIENPNRTNTQIKATVSKNAAPWTEYGAQYFNLTDKYQRYSFEFTMDEATDLESIVQFCVGKYTRTLYFDNIRLEKTQNDFIAPYEPKVNYLYIDESRAYFDWAPVYDTSGISHYILNYKVASGFGKTIEITDTSFQIDHSWDFYNKSFSIAAVDKAGNEGEDESLSIARYSSEEGKARPDWIPTFTSGENSITLSWTMENAQNVKEYKVAYKEYGTTDRYKDKKTTGTTYTITELRPDSLYKVYVNAIYNDGTESAEAKVYIRTGIGEISFPGDRSEPGWDAAQVYTGGDLVYHNGFTWKAKWWTQGEEPGVSLSGVWEKQ